MERYYKALSDLHIPVDMIGVEDDLSKYDLVIAPVLYMVKTGYDEKLRAYVKNGGRFLTTFFSGYVDEHDLVTVGGYPGKLLDILGIWVEEEDALPADMHNCFHYNGTDSVVLRDDGHGGWTGKFWNSSADAGSRDYYGGKYRNDHHLMAAQPGGASER